MKIDAKVQFQIDDPVLGIAVGQVEIVPVDMDYAETAEDVKNEVADCLNSKYATHFAHDMPRHEDDEYVIMNLDDLVDELK